MPVTSTVGRRQSGPLWTIKELAESGDPRVFWHWHGQNRSPKVTKAFREGNAEFSCPRSSLANIRTSGVDAGDPFTMFCTTSANRGSQSRPRGHAGARCDADDRTQDSERVRAIQYRERGRPSRSCQASRRWTGTISGTIEQKPPARSKV
jgi:hypothetical protein